MPSVQTVMAFCPSILLLLLSVVAAQSVAAPTVQPSNDTVPPNTAGQLLMTWNSSEGMSRTVSVVPLTSSIGLNRTQTELSDIRITGVLKISDGHSRGLDSGNIAYISCDPNNGSSNLNPVDVINQVIAIKPKAIVLYSFLGDHCTLNGEFGYGSIVSMTKMEESKSLNMVVAMSNGPTNATIAAQNAASQSGTPNNGSTGGSSNATNNSPPAPTTAVAMSILYSITGIITLLFLVIIATGAIRAHRHPERYGPRGGFAGRPRQSRAKGLARAMLETIPIIKFGDPDPVKPGSQSIQMEEGVSEVHPRAQVTTSPEQTVEGESQPKPSDASVVPESGIGPNTQSAEAPRTEDVHGASELGCSICTEDFEKGEDVRVLPCNHKFHPGCIDPWLLNVSGTCPLCRIDLRPAETNTSETDPTDDENAALPPPLTENEGAEVPATHPRGRVARRLDAALLRNAPAHVRIAALRELRDQEIEATATGAGSEVTREEQSRRVRLTGRLRDVFRIRTRTEAGAAGATPRTETGTAEGTATAAATPGVDASPVRVSGLEQTS